MGTTQAYATPIYSTYGGYGHYYGKREAEADADAYTVGQVHAGLPAVNAYVTGHPHNVGVVTAPVAASFALPSVSTSVAVPAGTAHVAVPATYTSATYAAPTYTTYGGYGHYYGKREAEADPEAYTIGQVNAGLHYANAYRSVAPSTPLPTLLDVLVMLVLATPLVLATSPVLATTVSTAVNSLANDQVWLINSPFTNKKEQLK